MARLHGTNVHNTTVEGHQHEDGYVTVVSDGYGSFGPLSLGEAIEFGALGASAVTNTGSTVVTGAVGSYPTGTVTGFPPGTASGGVHLADSAADSAQVALLAAYTAGQALPGGVTIPAGTLANGAVLTAGVYVATSSLNLTGGTVTLQGPGSFVFQIASTLVTASGTNVVLTNGAVAGNVFFCVGSSATLGTGTVFNGNILASTSITDNGGSTVNGSLLANTGAVTLNDTTINIQANGQNTGNTLPLTSLIKSFVHVGTGLWQCILKEAYACNLPYFEAIPQLFVGSVPPVLIYQLLSDNVGVSGTTDGQQVINFMFCNSSGVPTDLPANAGFKYELGLKVSTAYYTRTY